MTQLGLLSFAGLVASSLTYPLSGAVGDAYYRGRIVLWSLAGIAVTTVMMALAQGYAFLVVSKTLNGVAIGMLVPSLQALLGDIHSAADRGKAFGAMNFTGIRIQHI
jgi:DHA1 family multidrug resistance protein-like MFS transporter